MGATVEAMVNAIILGLFGLLGTLLSIYYRQGSSFTSSNRRKALSGSWHGTIAKHYPKEGTPVVYKYSMEITAYGRSVKGTALTLHTTKDGSIEQQPFVLNGKFLHNRYLKLDYKSKYREVLEFGSIVLSLNSDARELNGRFVGYGRRSEAIVSGEVLLKKIT